MVSEFTMCSWWGCWPVGMVGSMLSGIGWLVDFFGLLVSWLLDWLFRCFVERLVGLLIIFG